MMERMRILELENKALRERTGTTNELRDAVLEDAERRDEAMRSLREHFRTSPLFDVNKYATLGDFPGSIRLPGTNTSLPIGGFTQVDLIFDSNDIGSEDSFVVSTIPTDNGGAGQTTFSARPYLPLERRGRHEHKEHTPTDCIGDAGSHRDCISPGGSDEAPKVLHVVPLHSLPRAAIR